LKQTLRGLLISRKFGYHGSKAAKKRILFNILLISLVVGALVFAQIFVVSMSRGIADKYALLGNGHLQVHGDGMDSPAFLSGVLDIQAVAQSYALIYSPQGNKMVKLKGVNDSYFNTLRLSQITMQTGNADTTSTLAKVTLSTTIADELQVAVGDRIALMLVSDEGIRPQLCVVGSLYDSGYKELDANLAFCDYELMDRLFKGEQDSYWEVLVDLSELDAVKAEYINEGYSVTTWDQENYTVSTNLNTSRQAVLGVMVVVAMLCGYFISELSRELVEDDKRQIAMLLLLGSRHKVIKSVYFYTVMLVTFVSVCVGTLLGLFLAANLSPLLSFIASKSFPALSYYLLDFSVVYPLTDILTIVLVLMAVSIVSVQISLRRVIRIDPISCTYFE